MNIFEALNLGKATLPERKGYYVKKMRENNGRYCFLWSNNPMGEAHPHNYEKPRDIISLCKPHHVELHGWYVSGIDLCRNDWEPYVPRETSTEGKCTNCMDKKPNDIVYITGQGKCIVCEKTPTFYLRVAYYIK